MNCFYKLKKKKETLKNLKSKVKQRMSASLVNNPGAFSEDPDQEHGLLPDLNGVDLVMSLSPKSNHGLTSLHHLQNLHQHHHNSLHSHSTPFSVTDILSPIEEYRKLELSTNPPSPYRCVF